MSANVPALSQENLWFLSCQGQTNGNSCVETIFGTSGKGYCSTAD